MKDNHPRLKYIRLKKIIKEKIKDGIWRPGDRIFSERVIVEKYGVSRVTVKKAISDLIIEGILEHIPGKKGTFVKDTDNARKETNLIGVAIDDIGDTFGAQMLMGIEDYLWGKKYHPIICNVERNFAKVEEFFLSILSNEIAGVIFAPVIGEDYNRNNKKIIDLLDNREVPFVLIDRYIKGIESSYVITNYRESIKKAIKILINRGHKKILLSLGTECSGMEDSLMGYRDAFSESGLNCDDRLIIRSNDNLLYKNPDPGEINKMRQLIKSAGEFTAFFALNGRLLKTGIDVLLSEGYTPGKNIEFAAHGDVTNMYPPYTNNIIRIIQPAYEMGWEAAKILIENLKRQNRAIVQTILESSIVS